MRTIMSNGRNSCKIENYLHSHCSASFCLLPRYPQIRDDLFHCCLAFAPRRNRSVNATYLPLRISSSFRQRNSHGVSQGLISFGGHVYR